MFEAVSTLKRTWIFPCFGTIATSSELPLVVLMWIKMVAHECNLGYHLTERQGATVGHRGVAANCLGEVIAYHGATTDCKGATANCQGGATDCMGAAILRMQSMSCCSCTSCDVTNSPYRWILLKLLSEALDRANLHETHGGWQLSWFMTINLYVGGRKI
jgi:hypothetical protein